MTDAVALLAERFPPVPPKPASTEPTPDEIEARRRFESRKATYEAALGACREKPLDEVVAELHAGGIDASPEGLERLFAEFPSAFAAISARSPELPIEEQLVRTARLNFLRAETRPELPCVDRFVERYFSYGEPSYDDPKIHADHLDILDVLRTTVERHPSHSLAELEAWIPYRRDLADAYADTLGYLDQAAERRPTPPAWLPTVHAHAAWAFPQVDWSWWARRGFAVMQARADIAAGNFAAGDRAFAELSAGTEPHAIDCRLSWSRAYSNLPPERRNLARGEEILTADAAARRQSPEILDELARLCFLTRRRSQGDAFLREAKQLRKKKEKSADRFLQRLGRKFRRAMDKPAPFAKPQEVDADDGDDLFDPLAPAGAADVTGKRVGRNDPCPCGSGKKFKKCCG